MIKNLRRFLVIVVIINIIATHKHKNKDNSKKEEKAEVDIAQNMKNLKSELEKNLNVEDNNQKSDEEEIEDDENILKIPKDEELGEEESEESNTELQTENPKISEEDEAMGLLEDPEETQKLVKNTEAVQENQISEALEEPSFSEETQNPQESSQKEDSIDTSISEEDPEIQKTPSIPENTFNFSTEDQNELTITNSDLNDYKDHTKKAHEISSNISSQMSKLNKSNKNYTSQYNKYREKLIKLSKIYKKKYKNCLPLPTYLVENKTDFKENKKTKECRYAYYLGYNVVINWIQIVNPVNLTKDQAWDRIKKESTPADLLKSEQGQGNRDLGFKLSGHCFAKGMKSSFMRNFKKYANGKMIHSLGNPAKNTELEIDNMKKLMKDITKHI